jgi:hypothetical protein
MTKRARRNNRLALRNAEDRFSEERKAVAATKGRNSFIEWVLDCDVA